MVIENCPWVTNTELINEITVLNARLLMRDLQLDFSTEGAPKRHAKLQIISKCDERIIVTDDALVITSSDNAANNNMRRRLNIIANRIDFLAFVVESISKMKELDKHLLVGNMSFTCSRKTDDGHVTFEFERGLYAFGGGTFSYCKSNNSVELSVVIEDLDTDSTSVDISDLPKELELRLNLDHIDGFDTLTVSGEFCKEYECLVDDSTNDLAKDFKEAIHYLEKL